MDIQYMVLGSALKFLGDKELMSCLGGNTNVAWALSRSKLNPHLLIKLSKSHCTFGKWQEGK